MKTLSSAERRHRKAIVRSARIGGDELPMPAPTPEPAEQPTLF